MEYKYTSEKNHLILLSLLKEYGIRKVVASPGATNITLVASMQHDSYFEMYSCVDERSAAYMACGMAEQSGEPVIISCTGATSARNYMPALTEAYYRKLPVLAITSTQDISRVGHMVAQVTDRSVKPNDIVMESVHLQTVKDKTDEWDCMIKVNKALRALSHHGGGPSHINLTTTYSRDYSIENLPKVNKISSYYLFSDTFPELPKGRIAIFVGAHNRWTKDETIAVDKFCETNNAVVFCDQTSNYRGKYRVQTALAGLQTTYKSELLKVDLIIHIGEISGGYETMNFIPQQVWRVSEDGVLRDQFKKLTAIFDMPEVIFFNHYLNSSKNILTSYYEEWCEENNRLYQLIPDLPYSNIWMAQQSSMKFPKNSIVYLGILNSLRSWNFFETPKTVEVHSNTGGFGIDGIMSTLIGSSIIAPQKLHFAILGDLSFFYDMNSIGNRHIGSNVRIMIVNNGKGMEFRLINHNGAMFGDETDKYIAAAGHYGNISHTIVKHLATDLGYEYLSADNKEDFLKVSERFFDPRIKDTPIIFEVFTTTEDETGALRFLEELIVDTQVLIKEKSKEVVGAILGNKGKSILKNILKK